MKTPIFTTIVSKRPAFTLVELLVVISIMVVLLALITPALDQAELALCGANQHAIATGLLTYAAGHRSTYPQATWQ